MTDEQRIAMAKSMRLIGHSASFIYDATGVQGADRFPVDTARWRSFREGHPGAAKKVRKLIALTFEEPIRSRRAA